MGREPYIEEFSNSGKGKEVKKLGLLGRVQIICGKEYETVRGVPI